MRASPAYKRMKSGKREDHIRAAKRGKTSFAQILGKLYFFELLENLRRILLDYEQKHSGRTNAAFNAPC
jgi:hypothetical protein